MYKITRIFIVLLSFGFLFAQNSEELKRFMETYDKIKVDQEANQVVKKGIESEKGLEERPVRLLIEAGDITKYYKEKMKSIQDDLEQLNRLLISSDSVPPLSHFGYNYFSLRDSIHFVDNANVSSDYVLSYGDEVIISVWGQAEQYERKTLERDGTIFIENVGLLYLSGKTQSSAKDYIIKRFSKVYSTLNSNPKLTFLEFSIGKIKNINVTVAGNVQYPGNYVVNPSISISNILILAGGITRKGTLRNIYLQRGKSYADTLDLYPLITGTGLTKKISIYDGDIIMVPPRGKTVAITGGVLNSAYFEILTDDNVSKLINYAGLNNSLNNYSIIISRSQLPNIYAQGPNFNNIQLFHGDSLIVPIDYKSLQSISISLPYRPLIKIPWIENLTLIQILEISNIDYKNVKNVELIRKNILNNQLEQYPFNIKEASSFKFYPSDHLSINLYNIDNPSKMIILKGEVNLPGTYPLINEKESLLSLINRAGGFLGSSNINNVVIKRDTLNFGSQSGNLILSPGDSVFVNPVIGTIKVEGEVHNPGNFEWEKNISAKKYIEYAGGLTSYADKKHIIYITPYGEASKITVRERSPILPGSTIRISEKPIYEQNVKPDRFQQISSIVTSFITIAILVNTSK